MTVQASEFWMRFGLISRVDSRMKWDNAVIDLRVNYDGTLGNDGGSLKTSMGRGHDYLQDRMELGLRCGLRRRGVDRK